MWEVFERDIERKARAVLEKSNREQATALKYARRFEKRTGLVSGAPSAARPGHWDYDEHFDPIYCIGHARFIARRIWDKIQSRTYVPKPAVKFDIDKPDGGIREIMAFKIPDAVVANAFHKRLTTRNKGLFSSYLFAYRPDRNIFEAILHLQRMMRPSKTYILKYDYSKYFDTINHNYLQKIISDSGFVVSKAERHVISSFLVHQYASYASYETRSFSKKVVGVPQGSSLSLFLSNLAAHELDMTLERTSGSFVRFADDVIAVAHSYIDAREIELAFRSHCERAGLKINFKKSSGISLLGGRDEGDVREFFIDRGDAGRLKSVNEVEFLGHSVAPKNIGLTRRAVKRIKARLSRVVYIHLLQYPRNGLPIDLRRIQGSIDWDLVTCLNEVRKYIYGGLYERAIDRFLNEDVKLPFVRGVMAFYPLVDHVGSLSILDGWLLNILNRALRERSRLAGLQGVASPIYSKDSLLSGSWYDHDIANETSLPSFVRGWRAARKFYRRYGLSEIKAPSYYSLLSQY